MITSNEAGLMRGWFTGRLPEEWRGEGWGVSVDREEIIVRLAIPDVVVAGSAAEQAEARASRAKAFREETRERRIDIAAEAQHRFGRNVSWGLQVVLGDEARTELWTHLAVPVMTRLRQPQRLVLDTLVDAGVARSRADALAWCVRLVGQHEESWLAELREAMTHVEEVRAKGPAA